MQYTVVVKEFNSGLNELLSKQEKRYDPRIRKMRVFNTEKTKNDKLCCKYILMAGMRNIKLKTPIKMHYKFFVKDRKHDRSNIAAGFIKSFEDSLQELKILKNDGYNDVLTYSLEFEVDKNNPRVEVIITEVE